MKRNKKCNKLEGSNKKMKKNNTLIEFILDKLLFFDIESLS